MKKKEFSSISLKATCLKHGATIQTDATKQNLEIYCTICVKEGDKKFKIQLV